MKVSLGIALYIVIWWTVLFAVLPFFARPQGEEGEVVPGTPASAPVTIRVLHIVLVNSLVATLAFGLVYLVVALGLVPLGDFPDDLPK